MLVEEHQRARLDPRLLSESDRRVALLFDVQGASPDGLPYGLPGYSSMTKGPLLMASLMAALMAMLTLEIPCLACTRSQRRPCPSSQVATLTGHTLRVLYLAMSPDGQTIVTGAGDETLRFWNVFPGPKTKGDASDSSSMLDFQGRTSIR